MAEGNALRNPMPDIAYWYAMKLAQEGFFPPAWPGAGRSEESADNDRAMAITGLV
jgi:hypothetical protein